MSLFNGFVCWNKYHYFHSYSGSKISLSLIFVCLLFIFERKTWTKWFPRCQDLSAECVMIDLLDSSVVLNHHHEFVIWQNKTWQNLWESGIIYAARKFCGRVNFIVLFFCTGKRVQTLDFLLLSTHENQQQRENIWEKLWRQWFAFRFVLRKLSFEVDMTCRACSLFYAVQCISFQIGFKI